MSTKPASAFRLDPKLLEECRKENIDFVPLFEAAMAKAIKYNRCPYCGAKQKPEKNKKGK